MCLLLEIFSLSLLIFQENAISGCCVMLHHSAVRNGHH